jgi:hypothetical protein
MNSQPRTDFCHPKIKCGGEGITSSMGLLSRQLHLAYEPDATTCGTFESYSERKQLLKFFMLIEVRYRRKTPWIVLVESFSDAPLMNSAASLQIHRGPYPRQKSTGQSGFVPNHSSCKHFLLYSPGQEASYMRATCEATTTQSQLPTPSKNKNEIDKARPSR